MCINTFEHVFILCDYNEAGGENIDRSKCRRSKAIQEEDHMPTFTYPYDTPDELPWEANTQQCTLQRCIAHYSKLKKDLASLEFPVESRQSLEIIVHSLSSFLDIYKNLGHVGCGA